jgi:hypothetical protein
MAVANSEILVGEVEDEAIKGRERLDEGREKPCIAQAAQKESALPSSGSGEAGSGAAAASLMGLGNGRVRRSRGRVSGRVGGLVHGR